MSVWRGARRTRGEASSISDGIVRRARPIAAVCASSGALLACGALLDLEDTPVDEPESSGAAGSVSVSAGQSSGGSSGGSRSEAGASARSGHAGEAEPAGSGGDAGAFAGANGASSGHPSVGSSGEGSGGGSDPDAGGGSAPVISPPVIAPPETTMEVTPRVRFPWPSGFLNVCFDDTDDVPADEETARRAFRARVRDLVESTWGRSAALSLWGFEECTPSGELAIHVSAGAVSASGIGFPGVAAPRIMTLNPYASDVEVLYWFGRALGLEHDHGRQVEAAPCEPCDRASDCDDPATPNCLSSGFCGMRDNHQSIMAAPTCDGLLEPTRFFSATDALALQRAYGRKHAGALVGWRGHCLEMAGGTAAIGSRVDTWICLDGFDHNTFAWHEAAAGGQSGWLRARIDGQDRCAQVSEDGAALSAQLCELGLPTQTVEFSAVQLRTLGSMCVRPKSAAPGAELEIEQCALDGSSRWKLSDGRIQLDGTDLCVAVRAGEIYRGLSPSLHPCDAASDRQQFQFREGEIRFQDESGMRLCWNVFNGLPVSGSHITLWDGCGIGYENELFYISGDLRVEGGCLAPVGAPHAMGSFVGVEACGEDVSSRKWDFYW